MEEGVRLNVNDSINFNKPVHESGVMLFLLQDTVDVATQSLELTVVEVGAMGVEFMESGKLFLR